MTTRTADVVIVGGGIVGCAAAYYLARRGVRPLLLERREVGGAQSGRNWGFVRQQGRDAAELPLMVASNALWRGIEAELGEDVEWVQGGNLKLAESETRLRAFSEWRERVGRGSIDARILSGDEVAALLPSLRARFAGGLYTPTDGQADPRRATAAFARAAARHGAEIRTSCAVQALRTHSDRITSVITDDGEVSTPLVVCAAGTWSPRLLRPLGVQLPMRAVRATVCRTTPAPAITAAGVWGPSLAFRQRRDGSLVLAAAAAADFDVTLEAFRHLRYFLPNYWRNRRMFRVHIGRPLRDDLARLLPWSRPHPLAAAPSEEPVVNRRKVDLALTEMIHLFPDLADLRIAENWAGVIDITPDALPVIGPAREVAGLQLATGFSGHGFGLGPIVGRLLSELVVDGTPSLDLRAFRPERFAEGDIARASTAV